MIVETNSETSWQSPGGQRFNQAYRLRFSFEQRGISGISLTLEIAVHGGRKGATCGRAPLPCCAHCVYREGDWGAGSLEFRGELGHGDEASAALFQKVHDVPQVVRVVFA